MYKHIIITSTLVFGGFAHADEPESQPETQTEVEAKQGEEAEEGEVNNPDATNPMYVAMRTGAAIPMNDTGIAYSMGLSIGATLADGYSIGLRVMGIPDPPLRESYFGRGATASFAMGPVVEGAYHAPMTEGLDFFVAGAGGFLFASDSVTQENYVLPILNAGVGLRAVSKLRQGGRIYVAPEFGYTPLAQAPNMSLSVGLIR